MIHSGQWLLENVFLSFSNTCIPCFCQTTPGPADNLPEGNEILLISTGDLQSWLAGT